MIGTYQVLLNANCPVIDNGSTVSVEGILEFPATRSKFVTIRDAKKVNLNQYGKPEPILSTVRLTENTFKDDSDSRG